MVHSKPRVGVIGAGAWGKNVVRTFHALGALAAIAEANTGIHPALASDYPGIPLYADYRDLLAGPFPAVAIATPASSHFAMAREALLAGKDVLVEKPMTMSGNEAEELVALAREHGRILMVGHLLLFQPAVQWIKSYLDSGALGGLFAVSQERLNLGRARSVENALWSLGVHDLAVLLYLIGEVPSSVEAVGQRVLQPAIEDDVYLHLRFGDRIQAHLHTSWLWPEKRRRLVLLGSRAMLVYDENDQAVTIHRKWIDGEDLQSRDGGSEVLFRGSAEPLALEAAHFLEGVSSRLRSPLIDGIHGMQVVQVLEMATQSLAQGRTRKVGGEDAGPAPGSDPTVP